MMEALEKFMDALGITYSVVISRDYYHGGFKNCCIEIRVQRDGDDEYLQYNCYSLKRDGSLKYEEGNEVIGIHEGVLSYLGMDREIDNYFDQKARVLAKRYLERY